MNEIGVELEKLGFDTLWAGGLVQSLDSFAELVRGTQQARVASAIIAVDRFGSDEVAGLYTALERTDPGRLVVGLGGAHGPRPLATLDAYFDRLDGSVPVTARIMAALGPRMLDLARRRTGGAFPVLVTPEYTASARRLLGDDTTLAVDQMVTLADDPDRARTVGRGPLGFLSRMPAYQANFRRMGFADDEIETMADRLVDALIAWGDPPSVAARLRRHLDAGADHVTVSVVADDPETSVEQLRALAPLLII
jgi:probable F420-dependent oxidoreductase